MGVIARVARLFEDIIPRKIGDSVARRTNRLEEGGLMAEFIGLILLLLLLGSLGFEFQFPIGISGNGLLGRVM